MGKELADFGGDVEVGWVELHGLGGSLHVHDDDPALPICADLSHERVGGEAGDVIDDIGAGVEGGGGDGGFGGIDGDQAVPLLAEEADHFCGAVDFLIGGDRSRAWAGRFAADIDEGGTVCDHGACVGEGVVEVEVF